MGKYEPLGTFLRSQSRSEVTMLFPEIERLIGTALPASSKKYPAWWSNNPSNNVMTKVWLEAGFQTERVDVSGGKLVFRRVKGDFVASTSSSNPAAASASARRHPIFGCMDGLMTVAEGVDLTKPADPSWGD